MTLRVGVIGGGQLARMMIVPALELGLEIKVLAEAEGSSAALAATQVGDYNKLETVAEFAKTVDVITFDHEHVPLAILESLEAAGVSVRPPSRALAFAQNKLHMRRRLHELGLPMPVWAEIQTEDELQEFLNGNGGVCVLKTPIGGYDGKGVRIVRSVAEAQDWLEPETLARVGGTLLAEEKVGFIREVAQLSARTPSGEFQTWPLVQTTQTNGVCAEVIAPAPGANDETLEHAAEIARAVAEGVGVTGVLAVEMFETPNGRLLINELAMRPHNWPLQHRRIGYQPVRTTPSGRARPATRVNRSASRMVGDGQPARSRRPQRFRGRFCERFGSASRSQGSHLWKRRSRWSQDGSRHGGIRFARLRNRRSQRHGASPASGLIGLARLKLPSARKGLNMVACGARFEE